MFNLVESFTCRICNLHVEIIKQNQTSNEQYKFRVDLHKYHNTFNVKDYFMIQIRHEWYPLKFNHKSQMNSVRSFKSVIND